MGSGAACARRPGPANVRAAAQAAAATHKCMRSGFTALSWLDQDADPAALQRYSAMVLHLEPPLAMVNAPINSWRQGECHW